MTNEKRTEYIHKANIVHNYKYDYTKAYCKSCKDKIIVICPIHGEFQTTFDNHINSKNGCPKCRGRCYTTNDFNEKANIIHNHKYDYSLTEYKKGMIYLFTPNKLK